LTTANTVTRHVVIRPGWGRPPTSPNARLHWRTEARQVREARHAIALRARGAGIPTGLDHVTVTVHHRPDSRRGIWDTDNLMAGCKPIFDALNGHGRGIQWPVVADDTAEFMTQRVEQHPPVKGRKGELWIVLEWTEVDEEAMPV
jgi:hypothetical protein